MPYKLIAGLGALVLLTAAAGGPREAKADSEAAREIRTLLPKDAIPAIDYPKFVSAKEAEKFMSPDEMVIGVNIGGERRAYSVIMLSSHEIVNDTVGGRKIAVTW